ncbi:helix-hairpin-helix domain-containing protein [Nannocystis sp. ncelm1]|uniref:Helix-hairpin-helix domain-containing protein n=2 Tax=Nannocystis radixulma TaxID=2995305 RepID=A0ABT5B0J0_9BACT|nr:helix-hairpin-helix domain-containing protein [Nannocystis radixulma]
MTPLMSLRPASCASRRTRGRGAIAVSLALGLGAALAPARAGAAPYETFVDVDDEDDLLELNTAGDISGETFDTLVELLRRGVNLNSASREELFTLPNLTYKHVDGIIRYRQEAGFIYDPAALVLAGVLDRDQLEAIAAFIYIVEPNRRYSATSGKVRLRTAWSPPDRRLPAMVLDGQVQTLRHLRLGVAGVLTRSRVDDVRYDPNRDALSAEQPRPRGYLPKVYVQWEDDNYNVLLGTYRIGFGQRLTFDNTRNYTPNGIYRDNTIYPRPVRLTRLCKESAGELADSPCDGDLGNTYVTPDFRWQETLQGIAAGIKKLELPVGWMQAYAWTSVQARSVYQYKLYDPAICDDPRSDDPRCDAPPIYKRQPDPFAPTSEFSYQTLPRMFREVTSGGNVSYFFNRRSWIGATGYGTAIKWLTGGKEYDFQEWARQPFGGPFGAVGLNGAWGYRWSDLGVEVTRSFDSMARATGVNPGDSKGGGGFAAILRHTATFGKHEIETIVRYYDTEFANPYARPLASPDVYEGQRARDEAGGRIRYTGKPNKASNIRTYVNAWVSPSTKAPGIQAYLRGDYLVTRWLLPALWVEYRDKDMRKTGYQYCYGGDVGVSDLVSGDDLDGESYSDEHLLYTNVNGEPVRCAGEQLKFNVQMAFMPHKRVKIVPRYQQRFVGDPLKVDPDLPGLTPDLYNNVVQGERTKYRRDSQAWLTISTRPIDPLRIRARVRWLSMDTSSNELLEQSLWNYLDVAYLIKKTFMIQVRYDLYFWLDKRPSTLERIPRPENRFLVALEGRF